ncbi:MAG: DNA polymerase III subunit delta, partial [Muribaculaceae bacterium]|nr:DNA polymerase III subunit delta [Muribaculaceae bacterium]
VRENFIYNIRSSQLNYLTHDEEQFSSKFSPFINEANVERMVEELTRAKLDIQQNANSKIVLFDLAVLITILIKR